MTAYKKIPLGQNAIEHIREQLEYGNKLGRYLLEHKDLGRGTVVTFLPSDVSVDAARQLDAGGKVKSSAPDLHFVQENGLKFRMEPKGGTDSFWANVLYRLLAESTDRLCVIEEPLMKPGDSGFLNLDRRITRVLDNEIYYVLSSSVVGSQEAVHRLLRKVNPGWQFVCAVTSLPCGARFSRSKELTLREIHLLADRSDSIIVSAYDGEGYLMWSETAPL